MQLKWFHVRDFQSVRNSGRVTVSEITTLVGKNEAGKSSLLKALYKLNPVVPADGNFDVTTDYPRMDVEDFDRARCHRASDDRKWIKARPRCPEVAC
ncbi:AAA family ATPase [Bradyrhizobium sacchari]|uniref:AAA family ATPase n=1 Tax=Bradyrhizobium sacchari TaxID=1399419 RepID=UPI001FDAA819|nr:AAA family ATPase [Bradyrhizobium sacchari]